MFEFLSVDVYKTLNLEMVFNQIRQILKVIKVLSQNTNSCD